MNQKKGKRILAACIGITLLCTNLQGVVFAEKQSLLSGGGDSDSFSTDEETAVVLPPAEQTAEKKIDNPDELWNLPERELSGYVVRDDMQMRSFRTAPTVTIETEQYTDNSNVVYTKRYVYANGIPIVIKEDGGKTYVYDATGSTKLSET